MTVEGAAELLGRTDLRGVILVEGASDQVALQTLASRYERDLGRDGISVVSMGGATNIGRFLDELADRRRGFAVGGLYDVAEERFFRRGLERAGYGTALARASLEALGFFACDVDLEDELIRALGAESVEQVIAAQGELGSLRTFQHQPAQRTRGVRDQLRRFMGSQSHRKIRYARLLVEALDLDDVPRPLCSVLGSV
jgi:hypothetical protein